MEKGIIEKKTMQINSTLEQKRNKNVKEKKQKIKIMKNK